MVYRWCIAFAMNQLSANETENRTCFTESLRAIQDAGFKQTHEGESGFETIMFRVAREFDEDREFTQTLRETVQEYQHIRTTLHAIERALYKGTQALTEGLINKG